MVAATSLHGIVIKEEDTEPSSKSMKASGRHFSPHRASRGKRAFRSTRRASDCQDLIFFFSDEKEEYKKIEYSFLIVIQHDKAVLLGL